MNPGPDFSWWKMNRTQYQFNTIYIVSNRKKKKKSDFMMNANENQSKFVLSCLNYCEFFFFFFFFMYRALAYLVMPLTDSVSY